MTALTEGSERERESEREVTDRKRDRVVVGEEHL